MIKSDQENDYLELFGYIQGTNSCVKKLNLINVPVTGGADSDFAGALCGWNAYGNITEREQWKASVPLEESGFIKLRVSRNNEN